MRRYSLLLRKRMDDRRSKPRPGLRSLMSKLGPGLITGAADDDPSGIATYSQTGAQFGYGQLWLVPFLYPLMTAVQEACARIGAVTKKGIATNLKEEYGTAAVYGIVLLVLIANTINIGADIGAMAASANLLVPLPFSLLVLAFAAVVLLIEIFISYRPFAKLLKWTLLTMLAYPLTVLLVRAPWRAVLHATLVPHIESGYAFFFVFTAVVGTTISPYMFVWEASEEVEEEEAAGRAERGITREHLRDVRIDNAFGMLTSQVVMWCIIVVTGTVLNGAGITNVRTAADAAGALQPLVSGFPHAGFIAEAIFAIGVIGLGLVSVPVLAGSAAYAAAEAFNWNRGLAKRFREAYGFYGVITLATLVGLGINFIGIDPIRALVVTSVINALVAIPLVWVITSISSSKKLMGANASGWLSKTLLWITFASLLLSAAAMFWSAV